jgi:hypothetical protein
MPSPMYDYNMRSPKELDSIFTGPTSRLAYLGVHICTQYARCHDPGHFPYFWGRMVLRSSTYIDNTPLGSSFSATPMPGHAGQCQAQNSASGLNLPGFVNAHPSVVEHILCCFDILCSTWRQQNSPFPLCIPRISDKFGRLGYHPSSSQHWIVGSSDSFLGFGNPDGLVPLSTHSSYRFLVSRGLLTLGRS